ncbi:cytochrome b562 [Vibrio sp. 10N.261.55.A7]|uniref:cytochrome b562 n=1 Tax=Vibrio sp. 10N.261.55.A7 TaxID=1880851 RepID=UPI000CB9FB4C|nr:cytochrome b562 [Vibrio sp. 10N.261.55.A7]PMK02614.1 cytochrome b562 family protein [Vibrio sp. 10N.261.55.A7]
MKKILPMALGLAMSFAALSFNAVADDFDMTQTMKKMGLEFRQAAKAESVESMQEPIANLADLIQDLKNAEHPVEKSELYSEGFTKLRIAVENVESHLENGDLENAQQALREVDDLRIEFHDRRNPSIWSRIFG